MGTVQIGDQVLAKIKVCQVLPAETGPGGEFISGKTTYTKLWMESTVLKVFKNDSVIVTPNRPVRGVMQQTVKSLYWRVGKHKITAHAKTILDNEIFRRSERSAFLALTPEQRRQKNLKQYEELKAKLNQRKQNAVSNS